MAVQRRTRALSERAARLVRELFHRPRGRRRGAGERREQECRAACYPYKQWDAGLRYAFTPSLKLVAGVFDIEKPYYSLDDANFFRELGQQGHRGLEFSFAGQLVEGLNVVIGTILLEPRVKGEEVDSGRIGEVPVGQTERVTIASADYRLPWLPSLSVRCVGPASTIAWRAATTSFRSPRAASWTWAHAIDSRSGGRLRRCASRRQRVRHVRLANELVGSVRANGPRRFAVTLAVDFLGER